MTDPVSAEWDHTHGPWVGTNTPGVLACASCGHEEDCRPNPVSTEGLRAALFDCYALLPPERLDLLRDETKQTIDAAAALRSSESDATPDRADAAEGAYKRLTDEGVEYDVRDNPDRADLLDRLERFSHRAESGGKVDAKQLRKAIADLRATPDRADLAKEER